MNEFLDVDFERQPQYVRGDLGVKAFGPAIKAYGTVVPVIPEEAWKKHIEAMEADGTGADSLVTRIYNQRNEGSCVANACSQAFEIVQALKFGKKLVTPLSAISLYKRIGNSPGSGASVSDGLDEMVSKGVLPLDTPENRAKFGNAVMPPTGFYTPYPENWEATAKKFRVTEFFVIHSVAELITALLNRHPVVVGRSGHSICYCRPTYRDGSLVVKYANSWGEWGDQGFGYDSLGMIRSSASWAFAIRSVTVTL